MHVLALYFRARENKGQRKVFRGHMRDGGDARAVFQHPRLVTVNPLTAQLQSAVNWGGCG